MISFPTCISSQDSEHLFGGNTNSSFHVNLPHQMSLEHDKWQVALSSIQYPSKVSFQHLLHNENDFFLKVYMRVGDLVFKNDTITLKEFNGSTSKQLISHIEKAMKKPKSKHTDLVEVKLRKNGHLRINYEIVRDSELKIELSPLMAHVLGCSSMEDRRWSWKEGYASQSPTIDLPFPVDLERIRSSTLILETDLVSSSVVGDKKVCVLKLLSQNEDRLDMLCEHLDFYDLARTSIQQMFFELRDHHGSLVKFEDEGNPVLLNLLFKKKE